MRHHTNPKTLLPAVAFITFVLTTFAAQAQSDVPDNSDSIQEDIRTGRQPAARIEKQLRLVLQRSLVDNYVESVGMRLVRGIPSRYRQRGFVYRFDVVNVRDINAFALAGGPVDLNGGLNRPGAVQNDSAQFQRARRRLRAIDAAPYLQQAMRSGNL